MSLPHVLLTVLARADATGYEITREFDEVLGYFWSASHQHVYRELRKLEEAGQVRHRVVPQEGKPDRKVYAITDEGRRALATWVEQPLESRRAHDELLVRVLAAEVTGPGPLRRELERQRDRHLRQLARYRAIEREHFQEPTALPANLRLTYLTLRRGIGRVEGTLAWIEEALATLATLEG